MANPVKVIGMDWIDVHDCILYFSDDTFVRMTAEKLAACFPDREPIPPLERRPVTK